MVVEGRGGEGWFSEDECILDDCSKDLAMTDPQRLCLVILPSKASSSVVYLKNLSMSAPARPMAALLRVLYL